MANYHEKDSSDFHRAQLLQCSFPPIGLIRMAHIRTFDVGFFHGIVYSQVSSWAAKTKEGRVWKMDFATKNPPFCRRVD